MDGEHGAWEPLRPDEVAELFRGAGFRWWIAGGWALDLQLGRQTRPHDDIDVLVLLPDLPACASTTSPGGTSTRQRRRARPGSTGAMHASTERSRSWTDRPARPSDESTAPDHPWLRLL